MVPLPRCLVGFESNELGSACPSLGLPAALNININISFSLCVASYMFCRIIGPTDTLGHARTSSKGISAPILIVDLHDDSAADSSSKVRCALRA